MGDWKNYEIGDIMDFNPTEKIPIGTVAKKIPMGNLRPFERKIYGFEYAEYTSGPKFRNGDTLLAKITPCLENGKTAQVDILEENEVAFGSSEFIVLRANKKSDKNFIFYLAKSPMFRKKAISCMEGTSGRKRVNDRILKLQITPFPNLSIQKKIASVLSAIDEKIEVNNRINAELEGMAKTIYDYWFVQFDFPNEQGKPYKSSGGKMIFNKQLKRKIPEGWENKRLNEISEIKAGGDKPKKISEIKTSYFNISVYANGIINDGLYGFTNEAKVNKKSITISARGTIGHTVLRNKPFVPIIRLIVITPKEAIAVNYIFEFIKSSGFGKSGSVQQQLTSPMVSGIKILYPPKKILENFDQFVSNLTNKIEIKKSENQELTELRDWLLPMLMNGQVRVA